MDSALVVTVVVGVGAVTAVVVAIIVVVMIVVLCFTHGFLCERITIQMALFLELSLCWRLLVLWVL